ncbi:MAG: (d)CMP kinase [Clostridia bacterium]|nr:(d)CMP kinase [Clostridia bacterium]
MLNIALDGPGGAGKSTIAKAVAARLGIVYVDTGALYRTIGLHVRRRNADPSDCAAVEALLPEISLEIRYEDGGQQVYLNGTCVGDAIRTPEMSHYASAVSVHPPVRAFLLETQRKIARENSVIMDGRDIGTVILPDAQVKIFVTASPECRAERRWRELVAKGIDTTLEAVLTEMNERDARDAGRELAPTAAAEDALLFDNTGFDLAQSVAFVLGVVAGKTGILPPRG